MKVTNKKCRIGEEISRPPASSQSCPRQAKQVCGWDSSSDSIRDRAEHSTLSNFPSKAQRIYPISMLPRQVFFRFGLNKSGRQARHRETGKRSNSSDDGSSVDRRQTSTSCRMYFGRICFNRYLPKYVKPHLFIFIRRYMPSRVGDFVASDTRTSQLSRSSINAAKTG